MFEHEDDYGELLTILPTSEPDQAPAAEIRLGIGAAGSSSVHIPAVRVPEAAAALYRAAGLPVPGDLAPRER